MENFHKSVIPVIESVYDSFTNAERTVANFFITNIDAEIDFSAQNVSQILHVSEASITRFSKKCGFAGYREFIYAYSVHISQPPDSHTQLTRNVLSDYEEILNKTYSLIDENQIQRIVEHILKAKRVYFYGIGSSGLVAEEMKSRFMRLGLFCDAFTDADLMRINSSLLTEEAVVIALTISSETPAILNSLELAHKKKAKTVVLTAKNKVHLTKYCDEVLLLATRENLNFGNRISPQFPMLVIIDILYAYLLKTDSDLRKEIFTSTLSALDDDLQ